MNIMTKEQINFVIATCMEFHSIELLLNYVKPEGTFDKADPIIIKRCPPGLINKLVDNDYSLSMTPVGLMVSKIGTVVTVLNTKNGKQ